MTFKKDELAEMKTKLERLDASADKLKNKHLRDLVRSGLGRISDALSHPDIDLVEDDKAREETEKSEIQRRAEFDAGQAQLRADQQKLDIQKTADAQQNDADRTPNGKFPFGDTGIATKQEPSFTHEQGDYQTFAGPHGETQIGGDPEAKHPGDPAFTRNQDFQDPHNVDLNKDGTLKTAPNTLGTTDNRDK